MQVVKPELYECFETRRMMQEAGEGQKDSINMFSLCCVCVGTRMVGQEPTTPIWS